MERDIFIPEYVEESFDHSFSEFLFEYESMLNEERIYKAYEEICCLESGNYAGLVQINEGFIDSIKESITKIWNKIVQMVNKFTTWVGQKIESDKKFLEDNKEAIIKKNPIKGTKITTWRYDLNKLYNLSVNIPTVDEIIKIKNNKEAMNIVIKKAIPSAQNVDDKTLKDIVNEYVKGSERVVINSEELDTDKNINLSDMYRYCFDYKSLADQIKADANKIKEIGEAVEAEITKVYEEYSKKNTEQKDTEQGESTKTESGIFVDVVGSYLVEADMDSSSSEKEPKTNIANSYNTNINNTSGSKNASENAKNAKIDEWGGVTIAEAKSAIQSYYAQGGQLLAAKSTLATEIYGEYMQIMKWHVRQFTNKQKKNLDKSASNPSNIKSSEEVSAKNKEKDEFTKREELN